MPKAKSFKAKKPRTSNVRIIAGRHRGRKLDFVDYDDASNQGIRPTPDRVRETLFNWLTGHLNGTQVLDVCAGSGVLGFESLSRGAAAATLIEANGEQFKLLTSTQQMLSMPDHQATLHHGDALAVIDKLGAAQAVFDIIYIDPPFGADLHVPLLCAVIDARIYHPQTLIYIEADCAIEPLLAPITQAGLTDITILKSLKAGQVYAALLTLKRPDRPPS